MMMMSMIMTTTIIIVLVVIIIIIVDAFLIMMRNIFYEHTEGRMILFVCSILPNHFWFSKTRHPGPAGGVQSHSLKVAAIIAIIIFVRI